MMYCCEVQVLPSCSNLALNGVEVSLGASAADGAPVANGCPGGIEVRAAPLSAPWRGHAGSQQMGECPPHKVSKNFSLKRGRNQRSRLLVCRHLGTAHCSQL